MIDLDPPARPGSPRRDRRATSNVDRQRLVERAGSVDRVTRLVGALVAATLLATGIFRDAWAFLPLAVLLATLASGPAAIRRFGHPESTELALGLLLTIAMAVAAGLTGGTSSPIVFLLPIGVVMNALRAGPSSIVVCSVVTTVVFVAVSLLENAAAVVAEPLPMLAILVMQAAVTIASLQLARAELGHRRASIVDPLTGLLNRHGLPERFEELRQQALVSAAPVTVVLFDLDHFKRVNDVYGHDVGDRVLREVADEIRTRLRQFELVYRIGGEEFLVLLPGAAEWEGENIAEQLRLGVESVGARTAVGVTASFGISSSVGPGIEFAEMYRRADRALYRAKGEGRDRVAASGSGEPALR